jgi:hypothetical protein
MKVVTFFNIDKSLVDSKFNMESYLETSGDADIAILGIDTIFDFEENKSKVCKEKFASIAIIEDESDYDAFKNFGIDAWIKIEDISKINNILNLVSNRLLS